MSKSNKQARQAQRQAAEAALAQAHERARRIKIVVGVVVAALVLGGIWWAVGRDTSTPPARDVPAHVTADFGVRYGDGSHEVVIYEDFLCPFCGQVERDGVMQDLLAEADVTVEFRPMNLLERVSDYSERSTNAFYVVLDHEGPEAALVFHDLLYAQQPEESGPYLSDDALIALAVEAGAVEAEIADEIRDLRFADYIANGREAALSRDDFPGTPAVYVDGTLLTYATLDDLPAALDEALS